MVNITQVKICGITNLDDAQVAVEAGADLLGFILYPKSPRFVAVAQVQAIIKDLKLKIEEVAAAETEKRRSAANMANTALHQASNLQSSIFNPPRFVGVFVNATLEEIESAMAHAGLDLAQLHGDETPALLAALDGRAYKALRPADGAQAHEESARFAQPDSLPSLLVDAYDPAEYGGTGKKADWRVAAELATRTPGLLLAGGLTPQNVATAVAQVQPWGVDVASGVERAPGRKDHAAVRAFVAAAKRE